MEQPLLAPVEQVAEGRSALRIGHRRDHAARLVQGEVDRVWREAMRSPSTVMTAVAGSTRSPCERTTSPFTSDPTLGN